MVPRKPKYKDRLYINIQYKRSLNLGIYLYQYIPKYKDYLYFRIQYKRSLWWVQPQALQPASYNKHKFS